MQAPNTTTTVIKMKHDYSAHGNLHKTTTKQTITRATALTVELDSLYPRARRACAEKFS